MVADWHELTIPQRTMRPSVARDREQLDLWFAASRRTAAPISNIFRKLLFIFHLADSRRLSWPKGNANRNNNVRVALQKLVGDKTRPQKTACEQFSLETLLVVYKMRQLAVAGRLFQVRGLRRRWKPCLSLTMLRQVEQKIWANAYEMRESL